MLKKVREQREQSKHLSLGKRTPQVEMPDLKKAGEIRETEPDIIEAIREAVGKMRTLRRKGWSASKAQLRSVISDIANAKCLEDNNMNGKLFWTISLAIFAAGVCHYVFIRLLHSEDKRHVASLTGPRGEIGFAAVLAEREKG